MDDSSGSVLDASALLAYLHGEPGGHIVQEVLALGGVINIINYAEVLTRLEVAGENAALVDRHLREQGLIQGLLQVVPLTEEDAVTIAQLRPKTQAYGISLGDRACLATGLRLRKPVITADRSWAALDVGVTVRLIRE